MKITAIFICSLIFLLSSLSFASAYPIRYDQSVPTTERWYQYHVQGFDSSPPDKITYYYHEYPISNNKYLRFNRYVVQLYNPVPIYAQPMRFLSRY